MANIYIVTGKTQAELVAQSLLEIAKMPLDTKYTHLVDVDSYLPKDKTYKQPVVSITGASLDGYGVRLGYSVRVASLDEAYLNEEGKSARVRFIMRYQQCDDSHTGLQPGFYPIYQKEAWKYKQMTDACAQNSHLELKLQGGFPEWNTEGVDWKNPAQRPVTYGYYLHSNQPSGYLLGVSDPVVSKTTGRLYYKAARFVEFNMCVLPSNGQQASAAVTAFDPDAVARARKRFDI